VDQDWSNKKKKLYHRYHYVYLNVNDDIPSLCLFGTKNNAVATLLDAEILVVQMTKYQRSPMQRENQ